MYTDIILTISTVILAFFTGVLAYFTYLLWSEAEKTREYNIELNKPELSVIFEPSKKNIIRIDINIKNIGKSPIYNLKLKVENDLSIPLPNKEIKISESLKYLNKINYLRPSQEIEQYFMTIHQIKIKSEYVKFSLFFEYTDKPLKGKVYEKRFDFDFEFFDMYHQTGNEPIYEISESLKSIERILNDPLSEKKIEKILGHLEKQNEDKKFESVTNNENVKK